MGEWTILKTRGLIREQKAYKSQQKVKVVFDWHHQPLIMVVPKETN
jgi:hypothetical protein